MPEITRLLPRVIIFTTPTFLYRKMTKQYFRDKGIYFEEVGVTKDLAAARDMVRRSGQSGVPVVDIGGKIVVGFDRSKIDKDLNIR